MSAISGFCEKCNKFRKRHCDGNRNTCMSILFDTIEALQKENNGWQERYYELDAGHSRLFKDFCKLRKENEQLRSQVVRGKWKLYGNDDDSGMSYWCTVCNFQLSEDLFYSGYKNGRWIENGVFKYCPNCGAKMEAEPSKPG